jgi:hypothetical protein
MSVGPDLGKCLSFINCQLNPPTPHQHLRHGVLHPTVTISRQTGSGAMEIAGRLADFLQEAAPSVCGWAVFDKNLVSQMLKEHNLPEQLTRFIPEDRVSAVQDMIEQILGLHPPSETLIRQISETVVHLADLGHVILVGRAANVITRNRQNVFHVRLVAPLEKRAAQVMARSQMNQKAAEDFIRQEDAARRRYLKEYFKHDPDEVLTYDLVLNTGRFSSEQAARVIGKAVLEWMETA